MLSIDDDPTHKNVSTSSVRYLPLSGRSIEQSSSLAMANPETSPFRIELKNWATAEEAACEIMKVVHPSSVSEQKRKDVADFIQSLIGENIGIVALPYGSVPLKTYLPDADIDFTAFCDENVKDTLSGELESVLQKAQTNIFSELVVKEVQLISAEVKIVKCMVQNIVVDISFNQVGGLSTLCFFEQVDRLIGKDHLFKRSIILIKSWSHYESRILGAQHSLISTYALETLVLYIFNLYHPTLNGPLAVLLKFLDYFSKFDWETFCVSLNGPVRLSSLPDTIVELPDDACGDLLLKSDFVSSWIGALSVPSGRGSKISRGFQQKHLNIIDPLKHFNNLGRSVSKGNFYRVRSALTYGVGKLTRILLQPENCIARELNNFFSTTKAWNGGRHRPSAEDCGPSPNKPIAKVRLPRTCLRKIDDRICQNGCDQSVSSEDSWSSSCKLSDDDLSKGTSDDRSLMLKRMLKINVNPLIDLSVDYDRYLSWLYFGHWCNELSSSLHTSVCAAQNSTLPCVPFGVEEMLKKQTTTITYNSNMNYSSKGYGTTAINGKENDSTIDMSRKEDDSSHCSYPQHAVLKKLENLGISSSPEELPINCVSFGENMKAGSCNVAELCFTGGKKRNPSGNSFRSQLNEVA